MERPLLLTLVVVNGNSRAVAIGCYLKRLNSRVVIFLTRPNCPASTALWHVIDSTQTELTGT